MPVSRMESSSGGEIPALLNAMSIRPKALSVASYIAATSTSDVTSAWTNRPPTSSAAAFPVSPSRSTTATLAPSAASRRAVASPMPLPPPVTTATRSSRRCMGAVIPPAARSAVTVRSLLRVSFVGCDEDVLGLGERVQSVRPQLAAQPGLLEAAERGPVADGGMGVDRQVAGLDRARHPQRAAQVLRPDRPGQSVGGVIGDLHRVRLVLERDYRNHRPENLLGVGGVVRAHRRQHGGREPV